MARMRVLLAEQISKAPKAIPAKETDGRSAKA
jgi:hypothetical protein